ncbi:hypothetical protein [Bradyrhizobium roseum]|uniref:hypothetical protein n=1 Tax=Bradyrhizobium roseum TaxID=3056648 RepID=UPI00262AE2D9|nr:hypothetical protein [Bradyrhizobium roseus]WKA31599.1 hypothetical protein QUH67_16190 [Bradyrhizobium roseus]
MRRYLAAFATAWLLLSGPAVAADSKLSDLPAASALDGSELLLGVQGGTNKKITGNQVKALVGGVTSVATACGVTGGTITTTGTIQGAAQDSVISGTTYTLLSTDCGLVKRTTNASATTITVPVPTGFGANYFTTVKCESAAGCTLSPSSTTIDGSGSNISLANGASTDLYLDGSSAWHRLPGGGGGAGTVTTTGSPANGNLSKFSGPSSITNGDLAGDVTTNGTLATTAKGTVPLSYVASNWSFAPPASGMTGGATFIANQIYCRLFQFSTTITIGTVGLNVTTSVGGGNVQIAYYTNNPTSNVPAALISNTGSISTATTGNKSGALGANIQLGPGSTAGRDIWICVNSDNTTHVMSAYTTADNGFSMRASAPTQAGISVAGNALGLDNISCNGANCQPAGNSTFGSWNASLVGTTWTYNTQVSRFPAQQIQVLSSP